MLFFNELSFWERKEYLNDIDFVIIGSGIVGMSAAIFLKKRFPEAKITIFERGIYHLELVQKMLVLLVSEVQLNYTMTFKKMMNKRFGKHSYYDIKDSKRFFH